jgi:AcrR family transcriptional regulator
MSPRPRTIADEAILDTTNRVIARAGPADLTLAAVGREAGISPATLIQRFGSKRKLLLAVARSETTATTARFVEARRRSRSALGAAYRVLEEMVAPEVTPEALANRLAAQHLELRDPEFHRQMLAQARALRRGLRRLLDEAVTKRELRPCNTRQLARTAQAVASGALASWAVHREGQARRYVRTSLRALFAPLRPTARRRARKRAGRRKAR